jgi:hypothetical protein
MINFSSDRDKGSAIVEFPPALVIILFLALFPMINLLCLSVAYGAGWYLNNMEAREVVCHPPLESGAPTGTYLPPTYTLNTSQNWKGFMGVTETPDSPLVAGYPSASNPVLVGNTTVHTTVIIKPFLAMPVFAKLPWLSQIPGLGQPWTCNYYSTVVQEEQGQ